MEKKRWKILAISFIILFITSSIIGIIFFLQILDSKQDSRANTIEKTMVDDELQLLISQKLDYEIIYFSTFTSLDRAFKIYIKNNLNEPVIPIIKIYPNQSSQLQIPQENIEIVIPKMIEIPSKSSFAFPVIFKLNGELKSVFPLSSEYIIDIKLKDEQYQKQIKVFYISKEILK